MLFAHVLVWGDVGMCAQSSPYQLQEAGTCDDPAGLQVGDVERGTEPEGDKDFSICFILYDRMDRFLISG